MSEYSKLMLKLMELGLTEYESRVYVTLLNKGPLYASEIALYSGVPRTKIYEAVKGLIKKQLIESYGSPKKFSVTANPEPLEALLEEEEKRFKEIRSLINEIKYLSQKNGVTALKGNLQILGEEALENVFNDFMKRARYKVHFMADPQIFQMIKKHEKQLMSLLVSELEVNILIPYTDEELINDAASLSLPIKVGKLIDQKGIMVVDEEAFLIHNQETGSSIIIKEPYIVKLVIENIIKERFESSLYLKDYIKFLHTELSEDLIALKEERDTYKLFFLSALKALGPEELKKVAYKMTEELKLKTNIFEAEHRYAVPAFVELIKSDIKGSDIKYDETAKMITFELSEDSEVPPSIWFLLLRAYLNQQGKDVELASSIKGNEKRILQYKVPWEIEDLIF